jgi:hypothetical protein
MNWERLIIKTESLDCVHLLADWSWLVPPTYHPVMMTVFGDWFLVDEENSIWFLDLVSGKLSKVARSKDELINLLDKEENRQNWLMEDLAYLCFESGLSIERGQCLGFMISPVLGGKLELPNIEVVNLGAYQAITAQMHQQVQDLPEGTVINKFLVDGKEP